MGYFVHFSSAEQDQEDFDGEQSVIEPERNDT